MGKLPIMLGPPDPEFDIIELLAARKLALTLTEVRVQLGDFTNYQYMISKEELYQHLAYAVRSGSIRTGRNPDGTRVFWYGKANT